VWRRSCCAPGGPGSVFLGFHATSALCVLEQKEGVERFCVARMCTRMKTVISVLLLALVELGVSQDEQVVLDVSNLTRGTACRGDATNEQGQTDLENWENGGFEILDEDMEACTTEYGLGGFGNPVAQISECMQRLEPIGENEFIQGNAYSPSCADCFGALAYCTYQNCGITCFIAGGSGSLSCRQCSIDFCVPTFFECGGIDTTRDPNLIRRDPIDLPIVLGAAGGAIAVVAIVVFVGISRANARKRRAERELFAQQLSFAAANAPKIAERAPSNFNRNEESLNQPLRAKFAFLAQMDGEMSMYEEDLLTGHQIVGGDWWLASNGRGDVGLVPVSYVEEMDEFTPNF